MKKIFYKIHLLIIELMELKKKYRQLYFNQLIINIKLKERIENLEMNKQDKNIYQ
jgi:hypothetical protein